MTSPVEIKPVRIGDPKIRSKITFEVVTARVIESGGKKHVVRFLCFILFQRTSVHSSDPTEQSYEWVGSIILQKQFPAGILIEILKEKSSDVFATKVSHQYSDQNY